LVASHRVEERIEDMPASAMLYYKNLQNALNDGLGIVSRIWEYKARNWITSLCTADIDGDGDIEIIASSRDGRVYCLSKTGKLRWRREIGTRAWIGAVAVSGRAIPR